MRLLAVAAVAAVAAAGPVRSPTPADMQFARKALLARADLGKGWTASAVSTKPQTLTCPAFSPDLGGIVETGTATVTFRGAATQGVAQTVWVYRTRAQAAALWRKVVGKGYLKCLEQVARGAGGLAVTRLESGELTVPKLAQRTAGFRVIVTAKARGRTVTLHYDSFVVASGRSVAQVTLGSAQPIPSAIEVLLVGDAAKRIGTRGAA